MLSVLLLLCILFSIITLKKESPEGAEGHGTCPRVACCSFRPGAG